ncbi:MAG: hypothetical protein QOE06_2684 [Thermoleophilaceae bacterium]|nr:hypothetical protein [Thermoleophilaceae bacterium]
MRRIVPLTCVALLALAGAASAQPAFRGAGTRSLLQKTELISRAYDGGLPNGPSSNAVISNDVRHAKFVAFESDASNIVAGDSNGSRDVFLVRRAGPYGNDGSDWNADRTFLVSRGRKGAPANGPSFDSAVSGGLKSDAKCLVFRSAASNLVKNDTNGRVDAFLSHGPGTTLARVSLPKGRQAVDDTTAVAVSDDCSQIAFVTGGRLHVRVGKKVYGVKVPGTAADPSFSTGTTNALVFGADQGVYLLRTPRSKPSLVAAGGRNPVFSDIDRAPPACKRPTVAYEALDRGHWQIVAQQLGRSSRVVSGLGGSAGDRDSRNPVIDNAGCYITFETEAANLQLDAAGNTGDLNAQPDVYLYTGVRDITLVQSVLNKGIPAVGGGANPSTSYYANYIVFDSTSPLRDQGFGVTCGLLRGCPLPALDQGSRQVYMRYLGPV